MSAALSAILTHSGYDVDAVYDGQAAVDKALSQSYDCMIFDIMMPKKDGVQALKEIRDKGDMTPVIMLTARDAVMDKVSGLDVEEQELACCNSIRLANKETKLMKFFMANVGKALSTAQIFDNVWGDEDDVDESIVFIYVSYLREKLEAVQADIEIVGERGQDYVLTLKEAAAEV